jgi:hypothetical protein
MRQVLARSSPTCGQPWFQRGRQSASYEGSFPPCSQAQLGNTSPARRDSASRFITGSRASGKCVTKQSLVTRENGVNSSRVEIQTPLAAHVEVTSEALTVDLTDGRTISVPLAWYPRLESATPKERQRWRLIGNGQGVHWPDLDEDVSVENLLAGKPSGESPRSFQRWTALRSAATRKAKPRTRRARRAPGPRRTGPSHR